LPRVSAGTDIEEDMLSRNKNLMKLCFLVAVCIAANSSHVSAQGLRGVIKETNLTDEDISLMKAAAAELYAVEDPKVGAETIWQNPDSGAHGTVELTAFDGQCAELRHLFAARGRQPEAVVSRRCNNDQGEWKLEF
jgi:surface antigen